MNQFRAICLLGAMLVLCEHAIASDISDFIPVAISSSESAEQNVPSPASSGARIMKILIKHANGFSCTSTFLLIPRSKFDQTKDGSPRILQISKVDQIDSSGYLFTIDATPQEGHIKLRIYYSVTTQRKDLRSEAELMIVGLNRRVGKAAGLEYEVDIGSVDN